MTQNIYKDISNNLPYSTRKSNITIIYQPRNILYNIQKKKKKRIYTNQEFGTLHFTHLSCISDLFITLLISIEDGQICRPSILSSWHILSSSCLPSYHDPSLCTQNLFFSFYCVSIGGLLLLTLSLFLDLFWIYTLEDYMDPYCGFFQWLWFQFRSLFSSESFCCLVSIFLVYYV